MLALTTTHDGDVQLFLQPLDGMSLNKVSLHAAVIALQKQLREANAEPGVYVADNGIYSESNMRQLKVAVFCRLMELPQGRERWVIVRTAASQQRAQAAGHRQVSSTQACWECKWWHLSTRRFSCEADARVALEQELKGKPPRVDIQARGVRA
jgi:hypothetical protein